jgi:diguanylate cyclase (GGDEF)-like protein
LKLRLKIPLLIAGFVLITTAILLFFLSDRQRSRSNGLLQDKITLAGTMLEALGEKTLILTGEGTTVSMANWLKFRSLMVLFARNDAMVYVAVLDRNRKLIGMDFLENTNSVWEAKDPDRKNFDIQAIKKNVQKTWFGPASEIVLYAQSIRIVAPSDSRSSVNRLRFKDFLERILHKTAYKPVQLITTEIPVRAKYTTGANQSEVRTAGFLEIGISKDYIDRLLWNDFVAVLPVVLIVFFVIIVIAVVFSLDIVLAVSKLSIGTSEIGSGNLDHRITMKRKDELGLWADLFNNMAERLKKTMDELKDKYEEVSRLFKLATEDGLTKAFVHRYLMDIFENEMKRAKRQKTQMSFLMTDIDHFKKFNDTWGHQAGDFVLEQVSAILLANVRKNIDFVGRYGGEEFGIIMPATDKKGAVLTAEKLRKLIENAKFNWKGTILEVRISIGVSTVFAGSVPKETIVKWADKALYHSKESGRNRTTFYSEDKSV